MRNLLIIFLIILSCSCSNKEQAKNNLKKIEVKEIPYINWKQSVKKEIEHSSLRILQKKNLVNSIEEIKKKDFDFLRKRSSELLDDASTQNEYFIFYFSEGEIITSNLICLHLNKNKYSKVCLNFQYGKSYIYESVHRKDVNELNNILDPIRDELEFRDVLILSKINDGKLVSNIGYLPNDTLYDKSILICNDNR